MDYIGKWLSSDIEKIINILAFGMVTMLFGLGLLWIKLDQIVTVLQKIKDTPKRDNE